MATVYVLQKRVSASNIAPAIDTFIMVGFESAEECAIFWTSIVGDYKTPITVMPLQEYLQMSKVHRFFDETGSAGLLRKDSSVSGYKISTLTPLMGRLLAHDTLIIDVLDSEVGKFSYNQETLREVPITNKDICSNLLLGIEYIGSYIYMHNSSDGMDEFIERAPKMSPNAEFLVIYFDTKISTIRAIESKLWAVPHQSIMLSDEDILEVVIIDTEIRFRLVAVDGGEMV